MEEKQQALPMVASVQTPCGEGAPRCTPAPLELAGRLHGPLEPQLPDLWFLLLVQPPHLPSSTHDWPLQLPGSRASS